MRILDGTLGRVLRGLALLIAGLLLGYFSENPGIVIPAACEAVEGASPWWCGPLGSAVFDFGFTALSYMFIVAGISLIIFYEFFAKLLWTIIEFSLDHMGNLKLNFLRAIDAGRFTQDDLDEVFLKSFERPKGVPDQAALSLGQFVLSNILQQHRSDGGFWRRNYSVNVIVGPVKDTSPLDPSKFLSWRENSNFLVSHCMGNGTYRHSSSTSFPIAPERIEDATRNMTYDLRLDGDVVFRLSEHLSRIDFAKIRAGKPIKFGPMEIEYHQGELAFNLDTELEINKPESKISLIEDSFISIDDNVFTVHFFEPTDGMSVDFKIAEGYEVYQATISGDRFGSRVVDGVSRDVQGNWVQLESRHWCLPGIIATLYWRPAA